jgi:hypothetical protein
MAFALPKNSTQLRQFCKKKKKVLACKMGRRLKT